MDPKQTDDDYSAGFQEADISFGSVAEEITEKESAPSEDPVAQQDPAPSEGGETPPAKETATPEPAKPFWESIPEAYRPQAIQLAKRAQDMEHSFRSEQERALGQQARANKFEARIAELEARLAERESQSQPADSSLTELEGTFPEFAQEIRELRASDERMKEEIESRIQPVEAQAATTEALRQESLLDGAVQGWRQLIEEPDFRPAIARAPRLIRQAAEANAEVITSAEDAAEVILWYQRQKGVAATGSPNTNGSTNADQVAKRRQEKLQAAVSPKVKNDGIPLTESADVDDYSAGFTEADQAIRRGVI